MRTRVLVCLSLLAFGIALSAQESTQKSTGEQYVGTWAGTWEAPGASGLIEVTLEKDAKGAMAGKVSVTGEPTYNAVFKTLSFEGSKMTAKYDFPLDESAEVILTATFDGDKANGTWSARQKANDTEIVTGTWTVSRK